MKRDIDNSPPFFMWPLALGAVGFACGFFGPIALNPEANQGPLLGIFITGPSGALFGLVAGVIARAVPLGAGRRWRVLVGLCIAGGVGILFACLPAPERIATIIDAEVRGCESPAATADAETKDWERRVAEVTWAPPRKGWKSDVTRMIAADPGVVLEMKVTRSRDVYRNRKPWNRGTRFAAPWDSSDESKRYFARFEGASCERYLEIGRQVYLPSAETTRAWPPDLLPNYLGLQVLEAVPDGYRGFAAD